MLTFGHPGEWRWEPSCGIRCGNQPLQQGRKHSVQYLSDHMMVSSAEILAVGMMPGLSVLKDEVG